MDGYHMCAIHLQFLPLFWASLSRCPPLQLIGKNWHEWLPFQLVTVQAVDWYNDSEPLFSLFFFLFSLFSVTTFSHRRSDWIKKLMM